jgi:hypothetical protein
VQAQHATIVARDGERAFVQGRARRYGPTLTEHATELFRSVAGVVVIGRLNLMIDLPAHAIAVPGMIDQHGAMLPLSTHEGSGLSIFSPVVLNV